jgi:hypothetical protein
VVHEKEGTTEVPGEIVARALGNESLNGSARVKIASMKQFGLMDGRAEKLRLTDRAFQILESPDSGEVASAMAEAAYSPPLFADIHANKPEASDEAIAYWLRREKGFSADGAVRAIKAYRETTANVGLAFMGYNKGHEPEEKPGPGAKGGRPTGNPPAAPPTSSEPGRRDVTGLLLEGGTVADVGFSGSPLTREGVDMLIDYFKLLRRAIPEIVASATPSSDRLVTEINLDSHD